MGFGQRNHTSLPTNMSGIFIPEDDKKPVGEGSSNHINITVKFVGDGNKVFFRMKRDSALSKLMNAYYELGIEDGDKIEAFFTMSGGENGRSLKM
ncbi:hypothetical protein MKW98_008098 [Papaver atlanticum]|uniref:Rad60/SUMO-like domain-containing protein n=1 Tax=Papaver atlanticum TaxID=357466 RepID=A0AAD4S9D5_9MAGN|nr:hypothetical protein MKW98_008098 [Papaver atlanticum]